MQGNSGTVTCLLALAVGCAGAPRVPPVQPAEPARVEAVSSELPMRDIGRHGEAPGTLSLVDPEPRADAGPAAPVARKKRQQTASK
jgi:hypothetical protein